MAAPSHLRAVVAGVAAAVLAGAVLRLPLTVRLTPASQPPELAAARAEQELPSLGVLWGKVRAWEREGAGWTITWQPAHGMWLVRAWVPDDGRTVRWRLEAASWLPGVRLSLRAARALLGVEGGLAQGRERLGRRDWLVGDTLLFGALPAGGELPSMPKPRYPAVEAVLVGLLLAGAAARHLVPGVPSRGWRHAVGWCSAALVPMLPQLSALATPAFQSGVRPWVGELAFGAAATLVLGALVFAAQRFPAAAGRPPSRWVALALAAGVLAGRLEPAPWLLALAALPVGLAALVAVAALAGWLAGLAGDGLREVVRLPGAARALALAVLGVAGTVFAGPWLGFALAVVAAAAVERGWGAWVAAALIWGWTFASVWTLAQWDAALRGALAMLLLGAIVVGVVSLTRRPQDAGNAAAAS